MNVIRFYKKHNGWYADVAEHTEAENRMVAGADTFLEKIDENKDGFVQLSVGEDDMKGDYLYSLKRIQHDKHGASYFIRKNGKALGVGFAWLCNVTHTVLGEHPKKLYIYRVK